MPINRRRAPSSLISSQKKLGGHQREQLYAVLIGGVVLRGTQKGDIKDKSGSLHSLKSGKKWQVFLYGYERISKSLHLNSLQACLDAFHEDYEQYVADRERCIAYKELYILNNGRGAAKLLLNAAVAESIGANTYIESKNKLEKATLLVCEKLKDKQNLRNLLDEALFNNGEVSYLAIEDTTYIKDGLYKVFAREDILNILANSLEPAVSIAGRVPEDFNVAGQKTLLRYRNSRGQQKNIVEIEIRNDSNKHYRQVRFNMYSRDTLYLLLDGPQPLPAKHLGNYVVAFGQAIETFSI